MGKNGGSISELRLISSINPVRRIIRAENACENNLGCIAMCGTFK